MALKKIYLYVILSVSSNRRIINFLSRISYSWKVARACATRDKKHGKMTYRILVSFVGGEERSEVVSIRADTRQEFIFIRLNNSTAAPRLSRIKMCTARKKKSGLDSSSCSNSNSNSIRIEIESSQKATTDECRFRTFSGKN